MSYAVNYGKVNFIWKIPSSEEERHKTAQTTEKIEPQKNVLQLTKASHSRDAVKLYQICIKI